MKFYVIEIEGGRTLYGDFRTYYDALNYAESCSKGHEYTISVYDSEEDYLNNIG